MSDFLTDGTSALKSEANAAPSPRLVSFAILKANWNQGTTYLDNFVPFAVECLRTATAGATVEDVQRGLRANFGIRIPQAAVKTILGSVVSKGYAKRSDNAYSPVPHRIAEVARTGSSNDFLRCHGALVEQLRQFAAERYDLDWGANQAGAALDDYVDEFGTPIVLRNAAPDVRFGPSAVASPTAQYVVHAFVEHLHHSDPGAFGYLQTVVEGAMLTSVVFLPDSGSVKRKFRDATAYLDTPFLLSALRYRGDELAEPARELVGLLSNQGVRLACFEHTKVELRGVLLAAASAVGRRDARGPADVVAHFARQGKQRSDVELEALALEKNLKRLGVSVLATPPHSRHSNVDEAELANVLAEHVSYARESTLRHDLDSLTAVDRLRGGQSQPILEHSKAIFVTTNTGVIRAAKRYFGRNADAFSWPVAISDADLATLVWLKEPMAAPELPRKQIMAECYAALRPDTALWNRWLDEIERSDDGSFTPEQLDMMRFSPDAQRALMDRTLGDADAVDAVTIREVLASAEQQIRRPLLDEQAALQAQLDRERHLRRVAETAAASEHQRGDEADARAEQQALAAATARRVLGEDRDRRHSVLRQRAQRQARRAGRGVNVVVLVALVAVTVASWFTQAVVVTLAIGIIGVATCMWGIKGAQIGQRVEEWLAPRLERRAIRLAGDTE